MEGRRLDRERVSALFALFAGLEGGGEDWLPLVEGAAARLEGQLREEVDPHREMERLCAVAAACAYGDWLLLRRRTEGDEVKVGDITLKAARTGAGVQGAGELREHFLEGVADLLRPACPALLAVEEPL